MFLILILIKFLNCKTFLYKFSQCEVSSVPQTIYHRMVRYIGKDLEGSVLFDLGAFLAFV
jgi:hypothetical protein